MVEQYKLQVKLGAAEFTAEGPEKSVKEQFALFLELVRASPPAVSIAPSSANGSHPVGQTPTTMPFPEAGMANLNRVFARDESGGVSLRILPRTERRESDALMLLLYGFRKLGNQEDVGSGALMAAVRQSGLQLERVDHAIFIYRSLITEGGYRRGKRYGLNNQGVNHAEQLIAGML